MKRFPLFEMMPVSPSSEFLLDLAHRFVLLFIDSYVSFVFSRFKFLEKTKEKKGKDLYPQETYSSTEEIQFLNKTINNNHHHWI